MIPDRISNDITPLPHEHFIYNYLHSNALFCCLLFNFLFHLKSECCKPHKAACHPTKCDVTNDVKLFPTVYCRYAVTNFKYYPISRCVTITSALEYSAVIFGKIRIVNFFFHLFINTC